MPDKIKAGVRASYKVAEMSTKEMQKFVKSYS